MNRLAIIAATTTLLVAGGAMAQTPPEPPTEDTLAEAPMGPPPCGPAAGHHHRHHAFWGGKGHDALGDLPKPLTANAVKDALEQRFNQRPHVGAVTEKDSNVLLVEIVSPDGKTVHRMEVNRTTGAFRPAW